MYLGQNNLRVFIHGKLVFGGRPEAASTDSDVYRQGAGDKTDAGVLAQALAAAGWGSQGADGSGAGVVQQGAGTSIPPNVEVLLEVLAKLLCKEGGWDGLCDALVQVVISKVINCKGKGCSAPLLDCSRTCVLCKAVSGRSLLLDG
jgi:hypothetical protein